MPKELPVPEGRPPSKGRLWEPHEWNARLAERAKARGERPNIAQPKLGTGFVTTTEPPEMRDLNEEAKEKAQAMRQPKGKKKFKAGFVGSEDPNKA